MEAIIYILLNLALAAVSILLLIGCVMYVVGVFRSKSITLPWYGWLDAGDDK